VSILDTPGVQRRAGEQQWADAMLWHKFKQHPANGALPMLGEECAAHIRAVLGLTRKVLVADLDNTLWNGVIGEDGLDGIGIGPDSPEGEAHAALQDYMLDLKARGILLAVASKNNPEDAHLPFERHPHMRLRLEDFAAFEANWNDKVSSIRAISKKLALGLDSFVFLDDNPLEREWVRSQLPQVAVVEPAGASVFHFVRALDHAKYFFALSLSKEDLGRAEQYRIEAARDSLRAASSSMGEFLAQLNMRAAAVPVSDSNISRVVQLINKTNQFNLTTRRYTEAQVRDIATNPAGWAGAFELSDRMGSYGLIGVVLAKPVGRDVQTWVIDTWLMSCRALGREMENFMFDQLMESARARGIRRIEGVYRPTAKNNLVAGLLERFGFKRVAETSEETRFVMDMPDRFEATAKHIQNTTGQEAAAEAMA
jgi:FkbH-like protein